MPTPAVYPEWSPTPSDFTFDPEVARRLPSALAFRYLALPIAEESGRVTVLIADPYNQEAVGAIAAALHHQPYFVKGAPASINHLLLQIWPGPEPALMRLLVATRPGPVAAPFRAYVQRLGNLLNSQIIYLPLTEKEDVLEALGQQANQPTDLVAWQEPTRSWLSQFFHSSLAQELIRHIPTSILLARQPRWPLRHLLLVIKGDEGEEAALSWILRLAQPVKTTVTLLAVTPAHPWLYNREGRALQGLAALLEPDTPLAQQARQMAQQITQAGLQGELRLRQGPPAEQIKQEITASDPDLVIAVSRPEPPSSWSGDPAASLLRSISRPLLLVRSGTGS
jgi:nucleotide-binding universal stress UspA family protein